MATYRLRIRLDHQVIHQLHRTTRRIHRVQIIQRIQQIRQAIHRIRQITHHIRQIIHRIRPDTAVAETTTETKTHIQIHTETEIRPLTETVTMVIVVAPRQVMILVPAASVVFSTSFHVAVVIQIGMAGEAAVALVGWTMEASSMLWLVVIDKLVASAAPVDSAILVDLMDYLEY